MNPETAGRLLEQMMSDISEDSYCAGWIGGLEFDLWLMLIGGPRSYGMCSVTDEQIEDLKQLAKECGGWHDGENVIPVNQWIGEFAEWFTQKHLPILKSSPQYFRNLIGEKPKFGMEIVQSDVERAEKMLSIAILVDPTTNPLA